MRISNMILAFSLVALSQPSALAGEQDAEAAISDALVQQAPAETTFETVETEVESNYPPIVFLSEVSKDKLAERIRTNPMFSELDQDALGSPIILRMRYYQRGTAGGAAAGMTSAILSGSTLGLIPLVSNNDLIVVYEFNVHGIPVAAFEYSENFTDVQSLYNTDYGLKGEALEWAEGTVEQFMQDVADNPEVKAVIDEYQYYFGAAGEVSE